MKYAPVPTAWAQSPIARLWRGGTNHQVAARQPSSVASSPGPGPPTQDEIKTERKNVT